MIDLENGGEIVKKKILFLCTGNSARSQMAEAIINTRSGDRFIAFSAGTNPAGKINPYAIKAMASMGIDISDKKPKSFDVFANEEFDFIITLCNKGKEQCINFIGKPVFAHWGLPDPADFEGSEMEIMFKFNELLKFLNTRIGYFVSIPMEKLDRMALEMKANEIGNAKCDI